MDLKTRKLRFIQEFFQLESEDAISRFENLLKEEKEKHPEDFKPMTIEVLNQRVSISIDDSNKGKVTEINALLAQIEKWS